MKNILLAIKQDEKSQHSIVYNDLPKPWKAFIKFFTSFCNLMEKSSSQSLHIDVGAALWSNILDCVPVI